MKVERRYGLSIHAGGNTDFAYFQCKRTTSLDINININSQFNKKFNITQLVQNKKFQTNFMFAQPSVVLDPNILTQIDKGFIF